MSMLAPVTRWLNLKCYQFEITFGLYMLYPFEKFVLYSIAFLLISLSLIATTLYLPHHIAFLINRAWFYVNGESVESAAKVAAAVAASASSGAGAVLGSALLATSAALDHEL